jgi:uncharacterized protein (UPF0335 family)
MGAPPTKLQVVRDEAAAHRFAKDHLKAFVERVERISEEIKALNDDKRDIYAEAKANGFDVKALKEVIKLRAQARTSTSARSTRRSSKPTCRRWGC